MWGTAERPIGPAGHPTTWCAGHEDRTARDWPDPLPESYNHPQGAGCDRRRRDRSGYVMKESSYIDAHKGVTFAVILAMMAYHRAWGQSGAWLYLGLHGTYGLLWFVKGRLFPDKLWQRPASVWRGLGLLGGLSLYWVAGWLATSRSESLPPAIYALAPALFGFGVFMHFAADMQKFTALRLRPETLITGGLFKRLRNPNYLGELLIYLSFALVAFHPLPFVILALAVIVIWLPYMRRKDRSLSRYPGFEEYRRRSWLLLPFLF
jgi:protein-S-isoprenylcysteine O-methyltransferase Ste14